MAKEFYTSGIGSAQTLSPSDESKIKIYDDKAAADLDIANIEENEIVATKAGESEGVVEVVDTVEENNPNAISSGAVFDYVDDVKEVFTSCTVSGNIFSFPYSGKHGLFFVEIGGQGNNTGYAIIAAVKIYSNYSTHIVASAAGGTGSTVSSVSWDGTNITVTMGGQYFYEPKYRQL